MTYTITAAADNEKCHDCGEPATVALIADYVERETGYLDTVVLCEQCYKMNYANKMNLADEYCQLDFKLGEF